MRRKTSAAFLILAALALCGGAAAAGTAVRGTLNANDVLKDLDDLDKGATVTLDFGKHVGFPRSDGSFSIPDVPPGLYILEVTSVLYIYDRLWIEVDADGVRASTYVPGTEYERNAAYAVPYPLELAPRAPYSYFTPREGFNFFAILQNPMILMMGFMLVGVYLLPKLAEGIDPEELKRVQEEQAKGPLGMLSKSAQAMQSR
ncbi:hypothetical protein DFJ74DRAFT_649357 [Hyaloraphidium curvatum]|nr:hypothetical protein DFJ74DRAFT_649357 [Hyaloraphidium curvatum]